MAWLVHNSYAGWIWLLLGSVLGAALFYMRQSAA
jgi:hypothetical protein